MTSPQKAARSHGSYQLGVTQISGSTHPVETGLSAELVGLGGAEVVVGPEGLVECCDEVEKGLPATLVTQRVVPVLAALPQPRYAHTQFRL